MTPPRHGVIALAAVLLAAMPPVRGLAGPAPRAGQSAAVQGAGTQAAGAPMPAQAATSPAVATSPGSPAAPIPTLTLPVREAGQMTGRDRALLQRRELDVSRAAAFYGFDISDSRWIYRQVVCRSLPDHLMLSFESDGTLHGASHFTAVVPADPARKVQVVADYAHGLLPYRMPWQKTAAYEAFNRAAEEDRGERAVGPDSHWLNLGMCFVAMTGQVPQVAGEPDRVQASEALMKRHGITPIIHIRRGGGAQVEFSDLSSPRTGNWRLAFDARGRLIRAEREMVAPLRARTIPMVPGIPPIEPE